MAKCETAKGKKTDDSFFCILGRCVRRFDVSGYPTLKMFLKGEPQDYDGPREADGNVVAQPGRNVAHARRTRTTESDVASSLLAVSESRGKFAKNLKKIQRFPFRFLFV